MPYKQTNLSPFAICILNNKKNFFKFSHNFATGISGHHTLSSTTIKFELVNVPPKKNMYRSYKNFHLGTLMNSIRKKVAKKANLGIKIDQKLTFNSHIKIMYNRRSKFVSTFKDINLS